MRRALLASLLLVSACGGGTPTGPGPTPQAWTISGRVTNTLTGDPVGGATLALGGQTVTAGADGRWTLSGEGAIPTAFDAVVSASGFHTRNTRIQGENGRTNADVDIIRDAAPFSLDFYRQLARDSFDTPGQFKTTKRWITAPKFYINTTNPATGGTLSTSELGLITNSIQMVVPQVTGGLYQAAAIETGTTARPEQVGWIQISIVHDQADNFCGRATIGANPGKILFNYLPGCANICTPNAAISHTVVDHEIGHALGLYHALGGAMDATANHCKLQGLSDAEQVHARIVYRRPAGNSDVDRDPTSTLAQSAGGGSAHTVSCFRRR